MNLKIFHLNTKKKYQITNILEEDRINQALDELQIPNYDDIELQLQQEDMNDKKRKSYLNKILKNAKD